MRNAFLTILTLLHHDNDDDDDDDDDDINFSINTALLYTCTLSLSVLLYF